MRSVDVTVIAGLAWLALTTVLAAHGVEPVATFFFLAAWCGIIYTTDRLIARAEGRSLLARLGPRRVAVLAAWSAVNWFLYELANLRLANWYYVLVPDHDLWRAAGTVLAFGTVFPGVFWIDHWLAARGVLADGHRHRHVDPAPLSPLLLRSLQVAGVLSVVLALAAPKHFFPLLWGATALLVAPVNYRFGVDGWLAQWRRGRFGPTQRMLVAGAVAGGLWEFFNAWARARWIYTVPFFDELKLFEMPLLGFLGFPPFALECASLYRLLVYLRLAPAFGAFADVGPPTGTGRRALAGALAIAIVVAGYLGVDRFTVTSRTPRVADVAALTPAQRAALEAAGVTHLTQLVGWGRETRWQQVAPALAAENAGLSGAAVAAESGAPDSTTAALARLRRIVALYLHQGMGTTYGNRLVAAGFDDLDDLRGRSVEEVWQRLRTVDLPGPLPSRAQIKVWLRRLPTEGAPGTGTRAGPYP